MNIFVSTHVYINKRLVLDKLLCVFSMQECESTCSLCLWLPSQQRSGMCLCAGSVSGSSVGIMECCVVSMCFKCVSRAAAEHCVTSSVVCLKSRSPALPPHMHHSCCVWCGAANDNEAPTHMTAVIPSSLGITEDMHTSSASGHLV